MRSMKVLACVLLIVCASACKKSEDDGNEAGTGGGTTAGTSGAGTNGGGNDGGTAGTGNTNPDGGTNNTDVDGGVDSAVPPIEAPPAITELAESIADGVCGALVDCLGQAPLAELLGGESCTTRYTAEFLSADYARLQDSIDAKRVTLDSTKMDACVSGTKAMGCAIQTDNLPAACEDAIKGSVALGEECVIDADCEGTAFCRLEASCPSVCSALLVKDDECTKDGECGDKLACLNGKCTELAGDGDACEGSTGTECAFGFACWDADDDPPKAGECHTNAETQVGDVGDECSPGSVLCKAGLSCAYDGTSTTAFSCKEQVDSGDACNVGLPGQCPSGEYCNAGAISEDGTCVARPGDGDPCPAIGGCAAGHLCVPNGSGGGVCRHFQNNGGACKIDDQCRSGYCNAAVCEPPVACD